MRRMPSNYESLMSREQLWDKLYSDMQSRGVIESLRTQMRDKLLQNLALVSSESKVVNRVEVDVSDPHLLKTANALIVDHLRLCGFDFSLSLFLPESGVASVDEARYSLRSGLGNRAEEILDGRLHERPEDSLLLQLFEPMTRYSIRRTSDSRRGIDVDVQTEGAGNDSAKIGVVESGVGDEDAAGDQDSFQRRFFILKKSIEERKKLELAAEMERFKENEMKSAELDYARRLETERDKMRTDFDEKYKQRNSHLDVKEREMERQIKRKAEEAERELSNQRNVLIDESQRSKIKEENLRSRESDLERRREEAERRLTNLREILEQREKMVKDRENEIEDKVRAEVRRILSTSEEERDERLKLMKKEEERIDELKAELEKKLKTLDSMEEEEEAKSAKLKHLNSLYNREKEAREDLEEDFAKMRRRMEAVESWESLQSQNEALRRDLEEALVRERDSRDQLEAEKCTLLDLKHHMTSCSPEIIVNLKREAESLQSLVERQNENHRSEMEECGIRAKDLKKANKELRDVVQRQNSEIESFNQLVGDLQLQLRYSQEALRMLKLSGRNSQDGPRHEAYESSQEEVSDSTPKSTPSSKRRVDRSRAAVPQQTPAAIVEAHAVDPRSTARIHLATDESIDSSGGRLRDLLGQAEELHSTFRRIADMPTDISRTNFRSSDGGGGVRGPHSPRERIREGWRRRNLDERRDRGSDVREFLESLRPSSNVVARNADVGGRESDVIRRSADVHRQENADSLSRGDVGADRVMGEERTESRPSVLDSRPLHRLGNDNFTSTPNRPDVPSTLHDSRVPTTRQWTDDEPSSINKQPSNLDPRSRTTGRSSPPFVTSAPSAERNLNLSDYEKERSLREERGESEVETDVDDAIDGANNDNNDDDDDEGKERDELGTLMEQQLEATTTFNDSSQRRPSPLVSGRRPSCDFNKSEREVFGARASTEDDSANPRRRLEDEVNRAIDTINESLDTSKWRPLEESAMTFKNATTASPGNELGIGESTLGDSALPIDDTIQEFNRVPKFVAPKPSSFSESSGSGSPVGDDRGAETRLGVGTDVSPAATGQSSPDANKPQPIRRGYDVDIFAKTREDSESSYSGRSHRDDKDDDVERSVGTKAAEIDSNPRLFRADSPSMNRSSSSHSHTGSGEERNETEPRSKSAAHSHGEERDESVDDELDSELMKYVEKAKEEREKDTMRENDDSDLNIGDTSSGETKDESKRSDGFW